MACKTETKAIGLSEYSVTQWPATKAMTMKFRLGKVFGATLARIAGEASDPKSKVDNDAKALSEGLHILFQDNNPEEITKLLKDCVVGVACDGTRITESSFDELFSGDELSEVYKIFLFVLKVNFGNLMKGQMAKRLLAKAKGSL